MKREKTKIKIELTNINHIRLKWKSNKEKEKIINEAMDLYFNKEFCEREIEAKAILWLWVLDK